MEEDRRQEAPWFTFSDDTLHDPVPFAEREPAAPNEDDDEKEEAD